MTAIDYAHTVFREEMTPAGLARAIDAYHRELLGKLDRAKAQRNEAVQACVQLFPLVLQILDVISPEKVPSVEASARKTAETFAAFDECETITGPGSLPA